MANSIEVKNLSKEFRFEGNIVAALKKADFSLAKGSFNVIMGPSGSGKSTLVNLLGGLESPTEGEIMVDDIALHKMSEKELTVYRRRKVGFIFQFFHLIPNLSARENVELPLEFNGMPKSERRKRSAECLKLAELGEDRFNHTPKRLSGGEQQRVATARALAIDPPLILADEPTGNLDSKTGKAIVMLLKSLAHEKSKTVLVVTHDQSIAAIADKVLHIEDGVVSTL